MPTDFRSVRAILLFACGLAMAGCVSHAGWHYTPNEALIAPTHLPLTLAVQRFEDKRGDQNSTYFWLCLIPLVPYCTADYNRPDAANGFLSAGAYNFRPSADLSDAAATELRQSQLFHDVFVTDRSNDPGAQLTLRGSVLDTDWHGAIYSYLLGPYLTLPWLLGLPTGSVNDTLKLELQLVQPSNGAVLWTYSLSGDYTKS
jgi:hypothetical protein